MTGSGKPPKKTLQPHSCVRPGPQFLVGQIGLLSLKLWISFFGEAEGSCWLKINNFQIVFLLTISSDNFQRNSTWQYCKKTFWKISTCENEHVQITEIFCLLISLIWLVSTDKRTQNMILSDTKQGLLSTKNCRVISAVF